MSLKGEDALVLAMDHAEEIAGGTGGGTTQNKKFELIEEITVEGADVKAVERSTEPNGTPYSFEKVFIAFNMEAASATASITARVNNTSSLGLSEIIGTAKKYSTLEYDVSEGILKTTYQVPTTDPTWANTVRTRNADVILAEEINHIRLATTSFIPTGSKITIYGKRK